MNKKFGLKYVRLFSVLPFPAAGSTGGHGAWWPLQTSNLARLLTKGPGGFDSHILPPPLISLIFQTLTGNTSCLVSDFFLLDGAALSAEFRPDLLNGVVVITGNTLALSKDAAGKIRNEEKPFLAIPYYAWANRGPGQILVWMPRTAAAVRPAKSVNMKVD